MGVFCFSNGGIMRFLKKKFEFKISLPIFAFLCIFLIFIFLLGDKHPDIVKSTKITDWITCIFTGLMLFVAYKGFTLAKDWKGELTRDDGYRIALKIKDEQLHNLRMLSHTFSCVTLAKAVAVDAINNPDNILEGVNSTRKDIALINLKDIYDLTERMKICTSDLAISFRNLNSVGWEVIPEKKKPIDDVINVINNSFEIIYPLFYASQELLGVASKIYRENSELIPDGTNHLTKDKLIELIERHCKRFDSHTKSFDSMCAELLDSDMYILHFFRPIKK